jgi:phosphoenolpyruvate carboxylase
MDEMATVATREYRSIVFNEPNFMEYFRSVTPVLEYGRMNIGSRPSRRKPSSDIESLRAIPWVFAWTQTRFHLPVWLGFGAAFKWVIEKDPANLDMLAEMYKEWPFFRVTLDLVEMVFAKGDPRIALLNDSLLVNKELRYLGDILRVKHFETKELLLKVTGHTEILEGNPTLRQRLLLRKPYITTLNVQQALALKKMRDGVEKLSRVPRNSVRTSAAELVTLNTGSEYAPGVEDTLILTMKGIAAGMQNTG